MRSTTFLFACVLGLLPSLSRALQPVFSAVNEPFTLQTGRFEQFSVTLRFRKDIEAFVLVLSKAKVRLRELKLTDGNLTTSDGSLGAFFDDPTPGQLLPIRFGKNVPVGPFVETADFVVNTFFSPSAGSGPRLISLNGDIVATRIEEGEELFVKPRFSTEPAEIVPLDVLDITKLARFANNKGP